MKKVSLFVGVAVLSGLIALASACGSGVGNNNENLKKITDKKVNDSLTVTLSNAEGKVKTGDQELVLTFTDSAGKPVKITAAALNFNMPAMGTMSEMNAASTLATTSTAGQFKSSVKIPMAGEWTAQISYEGAETGKTTLPVAAF